MQTIIDMILATYLNSRIDEKYEQEIATQWEGVRPHTRCSTSHMRSVSS